VDIVLLGASGLLGSEFLARARLCDWTLHAPTRGQVDLTDERSLSAFFLHISPTWIVNCAAYTNVDKAESDPDAAFAANALGPFSLARLANWRGARVLHLSTDFVFDGTKSEPYSEDDATNPVSIYGKSKLLGEQSLLSECPVAIVVRTSWLFGAGGDCFPRKIIRAAKEGGPLRVVNDQIGSPTYAKDLAIALENIIRADAHPGIYHVVNSGQATWYEFARQTLSACRLDADIRPISTAEWPTPAKRPSYSVLSTRKYESLGFPPLPDWRDAVNRFASEIENRAEEAP
jgi:dTDP-4-dehydrorhamnose reductase